MKKTRAPHRPPLHFGQEARFQIRQNLTRRCSEQPYWPAVWKGRKSRLSLSFAVLRRIVPRGVFTLRKLGYAFLEATRKQIVLALIPE